MAFAGGDGSAGNPYQITTPQMLQDVKNDRTACYLLMNDLDMSSFGTFTPLSGANPNQWKGIFDGGGHTVSNLTSSGTYGGGLFYTVGVAGSPGYVRNLTISGSTLSVGGLVGILAVGGISNCHTLNCTVTNYRGAGGIVGDTLAGTTVTQCSATGTNVSLVSGGASSWSAGGLVGQHEGTLTKSFATGGSIAGFSSGRCGGVVGDNYGGTIEDCWSDCSVVRSADASTAFGGFGGITRLAASITRCYSTGAVFYGNGTDPTTKGFLGGVTSPAVDSLCHWDTTTSAQATSAGTATGHATAAMYQEATFTSWDFVNTWVIDEDVGYPQLRWETGSVYVAFNSDGGTAVDPINVILGDAYGTLPTPTRDDDVFAGWFTAAVDGDEVTAETIVTTTTAHTLYAQWTKDYGDYTTGPPVSRPGIKAAILSYPEIADADELKARALSRLADVQTPDISYRFRAVDLGRIRNSEFDTAILGETGTAVDDQLGIVASVQLREIRRSLDDPLQTELLFETNKRSLDDLLATTIEKTDDYSGPTDELPADKVNLPDGGTLDDWVGPDDQIDGGNLDPESIDLVTLAEVTAYTSSTSETGQTFTVSLLDPTTRLPYTPAQLLTGCQLSEQLDTPTSIVGDMVVVLRKSDDGESGGVPHLLLLGGGGDSTTNNVTNAYYLFWPAYTGLF